MYGPSMNFPGGIFGELERISRELDAMFFPSGTSQDIRAAATGAFPAVNIGTTPTSTEVYVFVPGVDPASLDVVLAKGVLTISGERPDDLPAESDGLSVVRRQRFHGKFRRVLTVPEVVDAEQVTASYRDGVLAVSLKRSEDSQPRRIAIS
ncbi:Hsp20/alpha crystallin family protein [Chitinimonas sp. PSY-7]|uniref:Hsp20 family protein n=1 Tax=Chitinimonas sp. PSY-7 TaxID=3459088 RepID=UPI0040401084